MRRLGLLFVLAISLIFTVSCISKQVPATETYYETETRTENYTDIVNGENGLTPETHWYCENLVMSSNHQSFTEVWYFGYKLPEHSSSKVIIQTCKEIGQQEDEMVSAYDISGTEHWTKPPFDRPHYIGLVNVYNVYPYEEKQFNEWLDYINARLVNSALGTQYNQLEYQFDTTGVNTLAIITAGCRSQEDPNLNMGYSVIPQQPNCHPTPMIKLIWSDEVTKEREVSYQVEKQRTVMETKQVPFWEAIFH